MENYVVCEKKGSHPRIHVEICRRRCKDAGNCLAFQDYLQTTPGAAGVKPPSASAGVAPSRECLTAAR